MLSDAHRQIVIAILAQVPETLRVPYVNQVVDALFGRELTDEDVRAACRDVGAKFSVNVQVAEGVQSDG